MNNQIEEMINKYNPKNNKERENVIKEIMQEIALAGLSRGGFFEKAAFYGETCLRIFYNLDRFSEDLDFALIDKNSNFKLEHYFPYLKKEFASYGIDIDIELKDKDVDSDIQSAFLKSNTLMLMMSFYPKSEEVRKTISNQKIKIKFEIDIDNPLGGKLEHKYRLLPSPYEVCVFNESTLFAGKIHAILCREYKHHVKGRDYYDYLFYVSRGAKINLKYLENKLKNSGNMLKDEEILTINRLKQLLIEKFEQTDYKSAIVDVSAFINDIESLKVWKKELFLSTINNLEAE